MNILLMAVAFLVIAPSFQQECSPLTSCSRCLSVPSCVWCSSPNSARCLSRSSANMCTSLIVDPQGSTTIENLPLNGNNQVSLSSVKMKLRLGEPESFTVSVRAAENYPLDFYILMDSSGSFQSQLNVLKNIAPQIVDRLRNVTTMFRVGLGMFVDKTTAPYNAFAALNLGFTFGGQPSACSSRLCRRPFSYNHVVNFTNSTEIFNNIIQDLLSSNSADDPEGTLDAMMQAVVCTNVVGWRKETRKVLLVLTDAIMHTAGDGRLAGIYTPNDGQCHTQFDSEENGIYYSDSTTYDYPSLEQMKVTLDQFQVIPVFAVNRKLDYFGNVSQIVSTAGLVEEVTIFQNLPDVIEQVYDRLIDTTQIYIPNRDYLNIDIVPICPEGSTPVPNGCTGIANNMVTFTVNVTLTRCSDNLLKSGQEIITAVVNTGFGTFNMELEGHCSSCDDAGFTNTVSSCLTSSCPIGPNDQICSGQGMCECSDGIYSCSCNNSSVSEMRRKGTACQCSYDNCVDTTVSCPSGDVCPLCNGHGTCNPCSSPHLSGCDCYTGFYGRYCEHQDRVQCSARDLDCIQCHARTNEGENLTDACSSYQCSAGYAVLKERQSDGYQVTESIPDTTISCSVAHQSNTYYYYTARSLRNGELLYEVVRNIPPQFLEVLFLFMTYFTIALGSITVVFGITITISCFVYLCQQKLCQAVKNTKISSPQWSIMSDSQQTATDLTKKGKENLKTNLREKPLLQDTLFKHLM